MRNKIILLIMFVMLCAGGKKVFAANNQSFSITPLDPDTNLPQSSYYDLKVIPKEKKILIIRLLNSSKESVKVKVEANDGSTNNNGITSYLSGIPKDETLVTGFSDIATIEQDVVTIPPEGSVDIPVTINIPETPFDGVILGGIRVSSLENVIEETNEKSAVTSNVAYTVGVLIKENDKEIDPEIVLLDVKTEQRNYRNYISAQLQNSAPQIVKNLEVSAQVTEKNSKNVLYEASRSEMRMAPNSNFYFGISLEDQPFKAGKYMMTISGKADGKPFSFTEEFEVKGEEAKNFNKNAVYIKETDKKWMTYLTIALIVTLLIVIMVLFKKKKYIRRV